MNQKEYSSLSKFFVGFFGLVLISYLFSYYLVRHGNTVECECHGCPRYIVDFLVELSDLYRPLIYLDSNVFATRFSCFD